jgi:hypothetical protein
MSRHQGGKNQCRHNAQSKAPNQFPNEGRQSAQRTLVDPGVAYVEFAAMQNKAACDRKEDKKKSV